MFLEWQVRSPDRKLLHIVGDYIRTSLARRVACAD